MAFDATVVSCANELSEAFNHSFSFCYYIYSYQLSPSMWVMNGSYGVSLNIVPFASQDLIAISTYLTVFLFTLIIASACIWVQVLEELN